MRYSLLLGADGGVLDDLMVTATPTGLYVVVNGAVKHQDIAYLRANLPAAIDINHLEDRALLALQGPKAVEAISRVIPGVDRLYFMEADFFLWGEVPLWISRSGYTGEDGFEIAQALRATLSYPFILEGLELKLDVSIGEAKNLPGESLADQLLRRADEAMYRAKRTKAGVLTWSPELGSPELGSRGMRL